eukprot:6259450-Amphidinium_carterae.1
MSCHFIKSLKIKSIHVFEPVPCVRSMHPRVRVTEVLVVFQEKLKSQRTDYRASAPIHARRAF